MLNVFVNTQKEDCMVLAALADMQGDEITEVAAIMEAYGYSLDDAIECQQLGCFYLYNNCSLLDVAEQLGSNCKDLLLDEYVETSYGVICLC